MHELWAPEDVLMPAYEAWQSKSHQILLEDRAHATISLQYIYIYIYICL